MTKPSHDLTRPNLLAAWAVIALASCSNAAHVAPMPVDAPPTVSSGINRVLAFEKGPAFPKKIYVANTGNNTLTTYRYDGTPAGPTITEGLSGPHGVAIDANGKIYVTNLVGRIGTVTAYDRSGKRTKLTIYLKLPYAIAIGANGKIYVSSYDDRLGYELDMFNPDGSRTRPTIITGNEAIGGVAVDGNGKIYLSVDAVTCRFNRHCYSGPYAYHFQVNTYNPDGSAANPTIRVGNAGTNELPGGVAVDENGKIYVVNPLKNVLKTYNSDGSPAKPTIKGLSIPSALAVDDGRKIYVANVGSNMLTTYNPDGSPAIPTIAGLNAPGGIALH